MWQKSGIFKNLFNNNHFLRNCEKPHIEPHLFPYVVSDTLGNEGVTKPEVSVVVEIVRRLQEKTKTKEKTYNTNNDCNNYDSYCYHDNYDNNHCVVNVVRVPSMYFFNFKLKMNRNINKYLYPIMLWFSRRTYKPFASIHRVGEAYGKEGYGHKAGLTLPKAIQSVSEMFSHIRWSGTRQMVETRLKRTSGTFHAIMDMSSSYLWGKVRKTSSFNGLVLC